jgi:hypothetical protein
VSWYGWCALFAVLVAAVVRVYFWAVFSRFFRADRHRSYLD